MSRLLTKWCCLLLILSFLQASASAQVVPSPVPGSTMSPAGPGPHPTPSPSPAYQDVQASRKRPQKPGWSQGLELRIQPELYDYFKSQAPRENDYGFVGVRLRPFVGYTANGWDAYLQLQNVFFTGLPTTAVAPSPAGALGQGGAYYGQSLHATFDTLGVRQMYLRLGDPQKTSLQLGRFDYASAYEVPSRDDPVMDWVKRERLARKIVGGPNYSTFSRTFDGLRLDLDTGPVRFTGFVARPTQNEPHFATEIRSLQTSNVAVTLKEKGLLPHSEAQIFWNRFDDRRPVPQVDDRPASGRGTIAGEGGNAVDTFGFHYLTHLGRDGDGVVWFAHQTGRWGNETHDANAFTAEVGLRVPRVPWRPWLRLGYSIYSGDTDPGHRRHGTFIADVMDNRGQFPMYTPANLHELTGQIMLSPSDQTQVRLDTRVFTLDSSLDLWYTGTGASQQKGNNGFTGRPSGGSKNLGTLLEFYVDHKIDKNNTLSLLFSPAFGGSVVRSNFAGQTTGHLIFLRYLLTFP